MFRVLLGLVLRIYEELPWAKRFFVGVVKHTPFVVPALDQSSMGPSQQMGKNHTWDLRAAIKNGPLLGGMRSTGRHRR
jgi:hypothetical protein